MRVGSLHVHPLKAGRIADRAEVAVSMAGPSGDRRWMVVDGDGRFLTQRQMPELALLDVVPGVDGATIRMGYARHRAALSAERRDVIVWRDEVSVASCRAMDDAVLSEWLGRTVHLVHFDAASARRTNADWADAPVAFADGYPVLIVLSASLDALNDRIVSTGGDPLPMSRFRPNVVIEGAEAWADDGWATINVGDVVLDLVKPCDRCKVTTVDQATGTVVGDEPLRTLRELRMSADRRVPGLLFGWNAVPRGDGVLRLGDPVSVAERRSPWPIRGRVERGSMPF